VNLINEKYNGKGRVFINTDQIKEMLPFGAAVFRSGMTESGFPRVSFFFKGEKAFKMAPNGCKVIAKKKRESCRCDGKCARCSRRRLDNRAEKRA
jgi:hypothetical protein